MSQPTQLQAGQPSGGPSPVKERGSRRYLNLIGLVVAWLVIFVLFSLKVPQSFPTLQNVETLARQTAIVGFATIGMTYIIIAGGIDLSVGSAVAFVTVVIAFWLKKGWPPELAALAGIVAGGLAGLWNGWWITRLRVGPFIVTLGSLLILRGLAKGLGNEQKIDAPLTWLSHLVASLGPSERWMILPVGVWFLLICAFAAAWALRYTVFGRHVVAIGSNELAARLCGVAVEKTNLIVYTMSGIFVGLAGLMQFSRLTVGDPTVAVGLELDVIAAVVIGGGSLSGGVGSIAGSLIGALIMTTIRTGANQTGLPNWVQEVATGCIIVAAVALDRWRLARSRR